VIAVSQTRILVERPEPKLPSGTLFRKASALIAAREARALESTAETGNARDWTNWLKTLNEFYRQLAGPVTLREVLELVLDRTFSDLRPEEGVIFLRRADGSTIHPARYASNPRIVMIGYGDSLTAEDKALFTDITVKHRRNGTVLFYEDDDEKLSQALLAADLRKAGNAI
jgi:hypothetical protein